MNIRISIGNRIKIDISIGVNIRIMDSLLAKSWVRSSKNP